MVWIPPGPREGRRSRWPTSGVCLFSLSRDISDTACCSLPLICLVPPHHGPSACTYRHFPPRSSPSGASKFSRFKIKFFPRTRPAPMGSREFLPWAFWTERDNQSSCPHRRPMLRPVPAPMSDGAIISALAPPARCNDPSLRHICA